MSTRTSARPTKTSKPAANRGRAATSEAIAQPPTVEAALLHRYGYDATAPLDVQETKSEERENATVHDITYAGPEGRIDAYLVVPKGDGPFPAVEFMPGAPGSRLTFLSTALDLAGRGIVSLLLDPPYARPPVEDVVEFDPTDVKGIEQEVKEIRRGVDLLLSREEVDPTRLAYVGFSWGGSVGAIASAVERRVHSFLLMSLCRGCPRTCGRSPRSGARRAISTPTSRRCSRSTPSTTFRTQRRARSSSSSGTRTPARARRTARRRSRSRARRRRPSDTTAATSSTSRRRRTPRPGSPRASA
jgi:hypothetical protein